MSADEISELYDLFENSEPSLVEVSSEPLSAGTFVYDLSWSSDSEHLLLGTSKGYDLFRVTNGSLDHLVQNQHISVNTSNATVSKIRWATDKVFGFHYINSSSTHSRLFIGEVQGDSVVVRRDENFSQFTQGFHGWLPNSYRFFADARVVVGSDPTVYRTDLELCGWDPETNDITIMDTLTIVEPTLSSFRVHFGVVLPEDTFSYPRAGTANYPNQYRQVRADGDALAFVDELYRVGDGDTYVTGRHPTNKIVSAVTRTLDHPLEGKDTVTLLKRGPSGEYQSVLTVPWAEHVWATFWEPTIQPIISPNGNYVLCTHDEAQGLVVYKIAEDVDPGLPTF